MIKEEKSIIEKKLLNLKRLDLSEENIILINDEIGKCVNLEYLDLSFNKIKDVPAEIGKLSNLEHLNLSYNQLTEVSAEIGKLYNLTYLDLSFTQLKEVPAEIGKLYNLTYLDLSFNELKEVPSEIGKLTNLEHLNLSNNELKEVPAEIGKLNNLKYLDLSLNELKEVLTEIGKLLNLRWLVLSHNNLKKIPVEIGNISKLYDLNLSNNLLKEIPSIIGKISNLKYLNLSYNNLKKIPSEIEKLSNLEHLNLSNNNISELPLNILKLTLAKLYIEENPIYNEEFTNKSPAQIMFLLMIDEKNRYRTCNLHHIPINLRTALKRYFAFFSQYIKSIYNENVSLDTKDLQDGLKLIVKVNNRIEYEIFDERVEYDKIKAFFDEYIGFIFNRNINNLREPLYSKHYINDIDKDIIFYKLRCIVRELQNELNYNKYDLSKLKNLQFNELFRSKSPIYASNNILDTKEKAIKYFIMQLNIKDLQIKILKLIPKIRDNILKKEFQEIEFELNSLTADVNEIGESEVFNKIKKLLNNTSDPESSISFLK